MVSKSKLSVIMLTLILTGFLFCGDLRENSVTLLYLVVLLYPSFWLYIHCVTMFRLACFVASFGWLVHAAPTDWEGSFNDSIYGGEIRVCVDYSASTSKYYAQALFSDLGE